MNITSVLQDPPQKCSPYEVGVGCKERVLSAQLVRRLSELLNGRQTKSPLDVQDASQISWPNQSDKGGCPGRHTDRCRWQLSSRTSRL